MLRTWAAKWGVPFDALLELERAYGLDAPAAPELEGKSEAHVQSAVRLEAAGCGVWLTRNNVGVLPDRNGRPVRFGLANESPAQNKAIKSGDLVGIRPVLITPAHVGHTLGQFVSRECKPAGWRYTGTDHEAAQLGWAHFINTRGGDAAFASGPGSFSQPSATP